VRRRIGGIARILIGLAVSGAALLIALGWAGWRPLLSALRGADYTVLLPAAAIYLVAMVARAVSWREILGRRAGLLRHLAALNEGYLLNNLLPWRLGELGRAVLLGRRPGLSPSMVLSSIVGERLFDMALAVGLLLAMAPVAFDAAWAPRAAALGGGALGAAILALAFVAARPDLAQRILARLPGGLPRWGRLWESVRGGLGALRQPDRFLLAFGAMAASWALAALEYWVVLRAFIPGAPISWALLALCVTLLGVAIPSAPGYVGVFEASAVAALAVFGVASSIALGYALVLHALHYAITTLLGAAALAGEGETLAGALRAARSWAAAGEPGQGA
jgi:uncharacterized membrane protein YbhN (UPF0104 family)